MEQCERTIALDCTLTAISALGIIVIFVPFVGGASPFSLLSRPFDSTWWSLAGPFLLAAPIFLVSMQWLSAGSLTRFAATIAHCAATVSAVATLRLMFLGIRDSPVSLSFGDWILDGVVGAFPVMAVAVTVLQVVRWDIGVKGSIVAMQLAYIGNAIACVIAAWPFSPQNGATLTCVVCVVYVAQIWRTFGRIRKQTGQSRS